MHISLQCHKIHDGMNNVTRLSKYILGALNNLNKKGLLICMREMSEFCKI
jgi:hypothetical protein